MNGVYRKEPLYRGRPSGIAALFGARMPIVYEIIFDRVINYLNTNDLSSNEFSTRRRADEKDNLRVIVLGGLASSLVNFRGALIRDLQQRGCRVIASAPEGDSGTLAVLAGWGIRFHPSHLQRASLNPLADRAYLKTLRRLFRQERPDVILAYTHKPVIYSGLAAWRMTKPPAIYALITGLGFGFSEGGGFKRRLAGAVLRLLYRLASKNFAGVIFQNPDDQSEFKRLRLLKAGTPQLVVRGSGVDLEHFRDQAIADGEKSPAIRFLLVARLLGEKGLREFAAAARLLKQTYPAVEFHLVGPADPNPTAVVVTEVKRWEREGLLVYHGEQSDVRPFLQFCTVYTFPSYYREGTPRTVLEAMATGRPVITTDAPGCRETIFSTGPADLKGVREGSNGFIIPIRSVEALVSAMTRFIVDPNLAARMGAESRRLAEEHYDVHKVNRSMLEFMGLGDHHSNSANGS